MLSVALVVASVLGALWVLSSWRSHTARRRLDRLAATSSALMFALDRDGRWSFLSRSCEDIFGVPAARMIGRPMTEFVAADAADDERRFLRRLLRSREPLHRETVYEHKNGSRVRLAIHAVGHRGGATGVATDLSHLRELERRLVQTERMHAVGALAGGVAHDFKNLLTVIAAQAEFASQGGSPALARRMQTILKTAERGRGMVEELLIFARNQDQRHEVLDLCEVVAGMEEMLRRLLRDNIVLDLRLPKQRAFVRADRGKIERVVMNLVVNAQDASPDGGRITVRVASGRLGMERTRELGIEPGMWAVLQVIDHGEGMEREVLAQVFEPFYTTKAEGKGTGLGLATVQGVVHQYGGSVAARSVPGRGTRMSVLLPLVERGHHVEDETTDSALTETRDFVAQR